MNERNREKRHSLADVNISAATHSSQNGRNWIESSMHRTHNIAVMNGGEAEKLALAQMIADAPSLPILPRDYSEMLEVEREPVLNQEAIELERSMAISPNGEMIMECNVDISIQLPIASAELMHV